MAYTIPNEADAAFVDQAEPDSRDFGDILAAAVNLTGVVSGCAVTAQASPDMTVAVAAGAVVVGGTSASVSSGNVTITAANASNPRFDLICVASDGTKSAVAGTAAANPVFPDPVGKCVLAAVYVPANDTAINSNQLVDKRVILKPWVQLAGDTMTGTLTITNTSAVVGSANDAEVRGSAYGTSNVPYGHFRRARGTSAAPLRAKNGDIIGRVAAVGANAADDTSTGTFGGDSARIDMIANEDQTSSAQGTRIVFYTTPIGSTSIAERFRIPNADGIDFNSGTFTSYQIRLKNNTAVQGMNNAGSAGVNLLKINTSDQLELQSDVKITDAKNLVIDTTTGTKIGTAASQKIGLWNATPVVQPTTGTDQWNALAAVGLIDANVCHVNRAPNTGYTLPANDGLVVPSDLEIASGTVIELASSAVMEIT